jgi:two-component system response regulator HydG
MDKSARMLIVDDNHDLSRNLADIFEDQGFSVRVEHDGSQAVNACREERFDVVLMDIKMPVMNGVDAYRRIKDTNPSTAVIMMTAFTTDELVKDALREGAYAVLHKPLDMEVLLSTIDSSKHGGRLILVIDDDTDLCCNLEDILRSCGHRVICARTSEEALQAAQMNNADVYLIDLKLPTMNGLETYLALKDIRPDAVAIIITAYADELPHLVDGALKQGAYACLRKPVDIALLSHILEQATECQTN